MTEIEEHYRRKHGYSALRYLIGPATFAMILMPSAAAQAQPPQEDCLRPLIIDMLPHCDPIHVTTAPHVHVHWDCFWFPDVEQCGKEVQDEAVREVNGACVLVTGRPCV